MSITATIAPTRVDLVQISDLDPELLFRFSGTATADGGGGFLQVSMACPADFSVVWLLAGGLITGTTSSEVQFNVDLGANTMFRTSKPGRPVDGNLILEAFVPPIVMLNPAVPGELSTLSMIVDNVNTENLTCEAIAFAWAAHVGRNIPQKFFWPATLA